MINIRISSFYVLFLYCGINILYAQESPHLNSHTEMAEDFKKKMQPDSAIIYYTKASKEFQKTGNTEKFVDSYNQIGIILTRQDKYEEARKYLNEALLIGLKSLEANHLTIATTYISLGVVYNAEQDYHKSLNSHHKALSIRLLKLGEFNAEVATSYGNIGNVYRNNKEPDKSIEAHTKAMKIRERLFGATSAEIIESYSGLGNAHREKKEYATSLDYFEKALKNKIVQRGEGHKELVRFFKYISEIYTLMENKEKAEEYRNKWVVIEDNSK